MVFSPFTIKHKNAETGCRSAHRSSAALRRLKTSGDGSLCSFYEKSRKQKSLCDRTSVFHRRRLQYGSMCHLLNHQDRHFIIAYPKHQNNGIAVKCLSVAVKWLQVTP